MIELKDHFAAMHSDLPSQFRDKERIKGLLRAFARQLDEVQWFLNEVTINHTINEAEGVQLDGIGSIVSMSRQDALSLSTSSTVMDDETYRNWLKYKIAINTSAGTYDDITNAIKMLIGENNVTYKESPMYPATAIFDITDLEYKDVLAVALLQKIKAAGVKLTFTIYDDFQTSMYIDGSTFEQERIRFSVVFPAPKSQSEFFVDGAVSTLLTDGFIGTARASPAIGAVHIGDILLTTERERFRIETAAIFPITRIYPASAVSSKEQTRLVKQIHAGNSKGNIGYGLTVATTERVVL